MIENKLEKLSKPKLSLAKIEVFNIDDKMYSV